MHHKRPAPPPALFFAGPFRYAFPKVRGKVMTRALRDTAKTSRIASRVRPPEKADPTRSRFLPKPHKSVLAGLAVLLLVTGCATIRDSRINPINWFGRRQAQPTSLLPDDAAQQVADNRILVDDVIALRIDRTPEGALISGVGLPPTQGFWDAELVATTRDERPDENGVLVYDFRIARPFELNRVGTQPAREVSVGHFISNARLERVRTIVVRGQRTQRSLRR